MDIPTENPTSFSYHNTFSTCDIGKKSEKVLWRGLSLHKQYTPHSALIHFFTMSSFSSYPCTVRQQPIICIFIVYNKSMMKNCLNKDKDFSVSSNMYKLCNYGSTKYYTACFGNNRQPKDFYFTNIFSIKPFWIFKSRTFIRQNFLFWFISYIKSWTTWFSAQFN